MEFLGSAQCYDDENEKCEEYFSNYDDTTFYEILDLIAKKENMTRVPLRTPSESVLAEMIEYADNQNFLNKIMEYEEVKD